MKHFLILLLGMLLLPVHMQAQEDYYPQDGLIDMWDFKAYPFKSLTGGKALRFDDEERYKVDVSRLVYDTLMDGRVMHNMSRAVRLPYKVTEMPSSFSVLTYYYDKVPLKNRDHSLGLIGKVMCCNRYCTDPLLEMDGGEYEVRARRDSFTLEYSIPAVYTDVVDEERQMVERRFPLVFCVDSLKASVRNNGKDRELYMTFNQCVAVGGKKYYSHRVIHYKPQSHVVDPVKDYLDFCVPLYTAIERLAIYNRIFTDDELKTIMGVDTIETVDYDDDPTTIPFIVYFPLAYIVIFVLALLLGRNKPFGRITAQSISGDDSVDSRQRALKLIDEAWIPFKSCLEPCYPSSKKLKMVRKNLKLALQSGCRDEDVVEQLDELAVLADRAGNTMYAGSKVAWLALMLMGVASYVPLYYGDLEFMSTTARFVPYYLAVLAIALSGFTTRSRIYSGKSIEKRDGILTILWQIVLPIAVLVASLFIFKYLLYMGTVAIMIMVGAPVTYLIVNKSTGAVVGTASSASSSSPGVTLLFMCLALWWIDEHWEAIVEFFAGAMVIVFPLLAYLTTHFLLDND